MRPATPAEDDELADHARVVNRLIAGGRIGEAPLSRLQVVDGQILDGPEHAFGGTVTLCGITAAEVFVMRHLFHPQGRFACAACAAAVRAAVI